jgi:glycosyltransferase involved in cell wall biosynthesis
MLSILIPTYNYNITFLVADLHQQAMDTYIDFEIIVMEDGSTLFVEENKKINEFKFCRHIVLDENVGRSAIRNKLADEAKYDHMLFLDCDAKVSSTHFVEKYISFCKEECIVLGGRIYDEDNTYPQFSLITKYGKERERNDNRNLIYREKKPMFTTPNFLISTSIFNKIRFDETIKGYGHEDTIFGIKLHQMQINFIFIDNPVIHIGLENNETFILKTKSAIRNLLSLYQSGKYPSLVNESKLLHHYMIFKKLHFTGILAFKYKLLHRIIQRQLCSSHPSLFLFDIYKLMFLCYTSVSK